MTLPVCRPAAVRRLLAGLLALAALAAAACARTPPKLKLCTWPAAVKPELVARFQRANGCTVEIETLETVEKMAARIAGGAGGCDLLIAPLGGAPLLHQRGLLQVLSRELLPNLKNVDPRYLLIALDPGMTYSVPYVISVSGIGYLASRLPDPEQTWALFDDPRLGQKAALPDDARETIGAALKFLGYSLNTRDARQLAEAGAVVARWLRKGARFDDQRGAAGLAGGGLSLAHVRNDAVQEAQAESVDVEFLVPREGAAVAAADLALPKGSRQAGLAHALINFLHEPKVAAQSTDFLALLSPNAPSYDFLDPELLDDPAVYLPPERLVRCEVIADLGADNAKYAQAWSEIKAAR